MSDAQKHNFTAALSNLMKVSGEDLKAIQGKNFPCHVVKVQGAIVTVQFDILPGIVQLPEVTIPVAGFEYIRYPIQVGDKGMTMAADVSLRGISGLGTGMATLSIPPTLTALVFVPLSGKDWSEEATDKITLYGPAGALIKTTDGMASVAIESDSITLSVAGQTLELSSDGLKHNGVNIGATHAHTVNGVESGSSSVTSEVPQ